MKVITIPQPYATLIAWHFKRFETRTWPPGFLGHVLIHAGRGKGMLRDCFDEPHRTLLKRAGYTKITELPMGCIIAQANLTAVHKTEVLACTLAGRGNTQEISLGNYSPCHPGQPRWAWEMREVLRLKAPIPIAGQRGIWDFEPARPLEFA